MKLYFLALATCVVVVLVLIVLLRTRRLKEKYAAVWLILAAGICVIGAFPGAVASIASFVGVATSSNLLFASALAVLFGVCIQLSIELSSNEEVTRTLTEEVALLRLDLNRLQHGPEGQGSAAGLMRSPTQTETTANESDHDD